MKKQRIMITPWKSVKVLKSESRKSFPITMSFMITPSVYSALASVY
jgi:hypothetical protein